LKKRHKRLLIAGTSLIALVLVAALLVIWFVRRPFPQVRGRIRVEGISETAEIFRDEDGVPHVYARNMEDLLFAQGYVHAQDRFWQMEFWRRIGSGRLSEVLGTGLLDSDRYLRTMGYARVAEMEYAAMEEPYRSWLDAYSRGVNEYIFSRPPGKLGLEFAILKLIGTEIEIEPWTPANSLSWAKIMAMDLSMNMNSESRNIEIAKAGGLPLLRAYLTEYRDDMPYIVSMEELVEFREFWGVDPAAFLQPGEDGELGSVFAPGNGREGIGSNNWVVSGELTASGNPLLANDMHLGVQMPSIWYEVGLHLVDGENQPLAGDGSFDVRGYSFPGIPGIIAGQNADLAWGLTNVGGDVQDYFSERINPENPDQYWRDGRWQDMEIIREEIYIEGQDEPEIHLVRLTDRGPVLSDVAAAGNLATYHIDAGETGAARLSTRVVSLSWTALQPTGMFNAIFDLNRSRNLSDLRAALSQWDVPGQNIVFADRLGNIGYQTTGRHPVRTSHQGQIPGSAADGEGWDGSVPFDMMPGIINPEKGYIVTANNPVIAPDYGYLLGLDFANGYRARRIAERIEALGSDITPGDFQSIHADVYSLHAEELLDLLLTIDAPSAYRAWVAVKARYSEEYADPERAEALREEDLAFIESALSLFDAWDYRLAGESPAAALYSLIWRELYTLALGDEGRGRLFGGVSTMESLLYVMTDDPSHPLWDNRESGDVEDMEDILQLALIEGIFQARERLGKRTNRWRWDDLHTIEFRNASLGESGIGIVERLFNRGPYPVDGGPSTVNVSHYRSSGDSFATTASSSQRSIMDPVNPSNSRFIHPTGQSGHPFNRHYADYVDDWREVKYHPGRWTREEVESSARGRRLLLIPR
jgi:penicillin amidase